MRLLIDENLPIDIKEFLCGNGHDAIHALDHLKAGDSDEVVFKFAQQERRIIVTCDLDFSDIRRYPPGTHNGIIVIRIRIQSPIRFRRALEEFLSTGTIDRCAKTITIVEEGGYRIRSPDIVA